MAQPQLVRTYRGTVDEVFSHRDEIPSGSVVELKVYEKQPGADEELGDFGGKSVADLMEEIGTLEFEPTDLGKRFEAYLGESDFGATQNRRTIRHDPVR